MFGLGKQASFVDNPNIQVQVFDQALEEGLTASPNLVGAIDQGTSSTRFLLFTVQGQIAASAQMEHTQIFPNGEDKVSFRLSIDLCRLKMWIVKKDLYRILTLVSQLVSLIHSFLFFNPGLGRLARA
jgi:hypothetical protein